MYILFILGCLISIHLLKIPTEVFLIKIGVDDILASLIAGTLPVTIITVISIWFIRSKQYIRELIDITSFKTKKFPFVIISILLFGIVAINSYNSLPELNVVIKFFFLTKYILAGISEELVFRVIILFYFLDLLKGKKIKAVLISSLIFGLMHFINYFKVWDFELVFSQVIFAFAMGCFFAGLFLKTENIYAVALIHILFNLGFTNHEE